MKEIRNIIGQAKTDTTMSSGARETSESLREFHFFQWRGLFEVSRSSSQTLGTDHHTLRQHICRQGQPVPLTRSQILTARSTSPNQKEALELSCLCENLRGRLSDGSFTPQQSKNLERPVCFTPLIYPLLTWTNSELIKVEEQLANLSKYNYLKSLSGFGLPSPSP